jgi:hypothetical protein
MAVMVMVEIPGLDQTKYDRVMKELGLSKKGAKWPKGCVSHVAGADADGLNVTDVWASEKDFVKFRDTQLGPAFGKAGITAEPRIKIVPVLYEWGK